jgi:amidase
VPEQSDGRGGDGGGCDHAERERAPVSGRAASEATPAGLADQAQWLAEGRISSRRLVEASLDRLSETEPVLNAFRLVRAEAALAEAEAADRRLAMGERGLLLGVPVAIKDDTDLAGEPTAFGCQGSFPRKEVDGEAIRRLRAAGAVIVGKTNTPELGQWPFTEGPAFGATRNPWNPAYSPGGSSGGSAATVAAGVVGGALGSDGAGSVRIPAAWTNLVGIKPQRGRISSWPDPEAFNGLTTVGPLARRVLDAALLLDAVRGNCPGDLHQPTPPLEDYALAATRSPGRLRIAVSMRVPFSLAVARPDPEIRRAVERLAEQLARLGHDVEDENPRYGLIGLSFVPRSTAALVGWRNRVADPRLLDPRTEHNLRLGSVLRGPALRLARASEAHFRGRIGTVFADHDVLLVPTTAGLPSPIGAYDGLTGWETDQAMASRCPYAWPWNVLGWPGINVPAGLTGSGLPLGAQLLGPACSETTLISLAAELEDVERWHERRPPPLVRAE